MPPRSRIIRTAAAVLAAGLVAGLGTGLASPAAADAAKPGQSMTHLKTVPGLASALEGAGVVLYSQGGATSAVMGESIAAADGQVVFHIPVTTTKGGVQHAGSTLVLFNTVNGKQAQLRNPVVDLATGVVTAVVPQLSASAIPVLTVTNASGVKPKVERKAGTRTTAYTGVQLALAPGAAGALVGALGLPAGAIAEGASFASADVTLVAPARAAGARG